MTRTTKHLAPLLLALAAAGEAEACAVPPPAAFVPVAELVARTGTIVLATAESAEDLFHVTSKPEGGLIGRPEVRYRFQTAATLKGTESASFTLAFSGLEPGNAPPSLRRLPEREDFDGHRDGGWRESGRVHGLAPDCEVSPRFRLGARYLIFVDQPWHVLGFEQIAADDDAWLAEVRRRIDEHR